MELASKQSQNAKAIYKQSELGLIPIDWEIKKLGDVAPLQRGFDLPNSQLKEGSHPVVYSNGITNYHSHYKIKAHGVVTGRSGTIGKVNYISKDFWPHNTTLWVTDFKGNYPRYIYFLYLSIRLERFGTGSGVPTLNRNDVHSYKIAIPSDIEEQKAIVEVLSDVDELIEGLETLIEKKRNLKQGTMQELLTGKTRLAGFSERWEVRTLFNIINCLDNLRIPLNETQRLSMKGIYPYCGANGILDYINQYLIDDDIILIAEDGGYFDEYAYRPIAYRIKGKCWVNNHAHILKSINGISQDYIYYSLVHKNILRYLASGTRAKLNKSELYKIEIDIPYNKQEQAAIAQILSDMDLEIDALEKRRDKYKNIKQGMMQELLTGKIRLI